ncbi:MAG: hypothetical protein ACOYBP_09040 [Microbacteriaceae bacterium]
MFTATPGTIVKLSGSGAAHHRKLSAWGTSGIAFAGSVLTDAEAAGTFEWLAEDGRDAVLRSLVSGREGRLFRGLLRRA